jgi:hypothetical protein
MVLAGCGLPPIDEEPPGNVPGIFKAYVAIFVQEAATRGQPVDPTYLTVEFATLTNRTVGICHSRPSAKTTLIRIDLKAWSEFNDAARELLMFHELGHCLLDLDHTTGRPQSVMAPTLMDPAIYWSNRTHLIDEMFYRF